MTATLVDWEGLAWVTEIDTPREMVFLPVAGVEKRMRVFCLTSLRRLEYREHPPLPASGVRW